MKKPEAILFDVGDTLVEYFENNPLQGTKELLKYAKNPDSIGAEDIQRYAIEMGEVFNYSRELGKIEFSMRSFQRFLFEMHNIYFDLTPLEVENIFNEHAFKGEQMSGANDFLAYLEEVGIRKTILSNSSFSEEAIREELRSYGIDDSRFEFVISTSEYGFRKPDKRIFELALKKLNLSRDEVWYIGNSYKYDVLGANGAGIFPVWLNKVGEVKIESKGNEVVEDILEVKSFEEIRLCLKGMETLENAY